MSTAAPVINTSAHAKDCSASVAIFTKCRIANTARASAAYVEVAATLSSRIESVRALVRTSAATLFNARYDRVQLPWRGRGGEVFVMGLSLRRELSIVG